LESSKDLPITVDFPEAHVPDSKHCDAELYDLALDFCRECLGWSNASRNGHRSIVENKRRPECPHAWTKINGFQLDPHDISHLIDAARQWSDVHGCSLFIAYSPGQEPNLWSVRIAAHAFSGHTLNAALMRACLAANRAMPSTAQLHPADTPLTRSNPAILAEPWGDVRANGPIALAFCKECLDWTDARLINDFGYLYVKESVAKELADTPLPPWDRSFHFNENHVDKVINAVRKWSDARKTGFTLEYFPSGSATDCWRAAVGPSATCGDLASAALMSACVSAQHRLTLPGKTEGHRDRSNDQP
jgi:hypothetical protein